MLTTGEDGVGLLTSILYPRFTGRQTLGKERKGDGTTLPPPPLPPPLPPLPQFSPLSKSCEMVHPIIIRVLILLYWGVARWLAQVAVATDSPPVSLSE